MAKVKAKYLGVICPQCKVDAFDPCRDEIGRVLSGVHEKRRRQWKQIFQQQVTK